MHSVTQIFKMSLFSACYFCHYHQARSTLSQSRYDSNVLLFTHVHAQISDACRVHVRVDRSLVRQCRHQRVHAFHERHAQPHRGVARRRKSPFRWYFWHTAHTAAGFRPCTTPFFVQRLLEQQPTFLLFVAYLPDQESASESAPAPDARPEPPSS